MAEITGRPPRQIEPAVLRLRKHGFLAKTKRRAATSSPPPAALRCCRPGRSGPRGAGTPPHQVRPAPASGTPCAPAEKLTIDDIIMRVAEGGERDPRSNIRKYLAALARAGYVRQMPVREAALNPPRTAACAGGWCRTPAPSPLWQLSQRRAATTAIWRCRCRSLQKSTAHRRGRPHRRRRASLSPPHPSPPSRVARAARPPPSPPAAASRPSPTGSACRAPPLSLVFADKYPARTDKIARPRHGRARPRALPLSPISKSPARSAANSATAAPRPAARARCATGAPARGCEIGNRLKGSPFMRSHLHHPLSHGSHPPRRRPALARALRALRISRLALQGIALATGLIVLFGIVGRLDYETERADGS
ncbi:MAG: hypothetical protein M5R42_16825 [Rhodocyclaceae bacterium]|nr:hypothetical protein [Rhodocyclaceae bacterium]